MAANRRSTWRYLATLLLLVTVPAAGSIPALPPPTPKADLVSADLLGDIASPARSEILALVAFVVPEDFPFWTDPHRKTRVWSSNLTSETQPIGEMWFKGEIAVGVLVVRFYHADGLGSVRVLTDETGAVTDRYSFTAFGERLEHVGDDENAYLFAGEPLDPNSGFYYNRARWMDPGVGRFVSVDPFGGWSFEPVSLHRYLYAELQPVDYFDPSGRTTAAGGLSGVILGFAVLSLLAVSVIPTTGIETLRRAFSFEVRLQAQGSGLQLSFPISRHRPVTVIEGNLGLLSLEMMMSKRERKARLEALAKAAKWISSRPPLGAGPPGRSGFTNKGVKGSVARIDVEILKGQNFLW